MGKPAVVLALIVSYPMPVEKHPVEDTVKEARYTAGVLDVKGTIIFTSKSLLGQWKDQIKRHAPHLRTYRHFNKSKLKLADLTHADVIIFARTVEWSSVFSN